MFGLTQKHIRQEQYKTFTRGDKHKTGGVVAISTL